jgi:hypothetical protein
MTVTLTLHIRTFEPDLMLFLVARNISVGSGTKGLDEAAI